MRFINQGEPFKIRMGKLGEHYWKTVKKGEVVKLPDEVGKRIESLKQFKTTEGQINSKKVQTKQIDTSKTTDSSTMTSGYTPDNKFLKELTSIKGIGKKTAQDIVTWGTKEKLLQEIEKEKRLPFRDDIVKLLEEKYGSKN